jgi:hypothetical protein
MPGKPITEATDEQLNTLMAIHCSLSPENLSADGEHPRSYQRARYRELTKQLDDLRKSGGFSDAVTDEVAVWKELDARAKAKSGTTVG